ncbi:MAG: hypothetical protein J5U19_15710, partial [Candidatus Methanoperedens sp.]|nr:hypothetical protein [Candidatus Methanoperedens sp.]
LRTRKDCIRWRASEKSAFPYEIIEYHGKKLLIPQGKLKSAVNLTWEHIRDPETAELAKELGIVPRKIRGVVLQ